jgi:hypothetical protein
MTRSMSIILLLVTALLLGTIASIHARSEPSGQTSSLDNTPGPHNPNQPAAEAAARRGV